MDSPAAPTDDREPSAPSTSLSTAVLLAGLAVLLVALVLEPYVGYAAFGSDTGEYYYLTQHLVATGGLPHGSAYGGWGTAYPDFPGIYLLAGAAAQTFSVGPFSALTVVVPAVSALSVVPLFLLLRPPGSRARGGRRTAADSGSPLDLRGFPFRLHLP